MVEVRDAFACEFEVLGLVFADWDVCCSVFAVSASCRSCSFRSHLSPRILKSGTFTYEPKYPQPAKPDTRKALASTSLSSHQADSRRLLSRVYSVPISSFPLLSLFPLFFSFLPPFPFPFLMILTKQHESQKTHLPLRHPPKIAHTSRTTQNPHELRMLLHVTLHKDRTSPPFPISSHSSAFAQTQSQQNPQHLPPPSPQFFR